MTTEKEDKQMVIREIKHIMHKIDIVGDGSIKSFCKWVLEK